MKINKFLIISLICFILPLVSSAGPGLEVLRERVIAELLDPPVNEMQVKSLVNSILADGSWPDINYQDTSRTGFEHRMHLENLLKATSYRKKELEKIIKIRKGELKPGLISNQFFWCTKYLSHQRPAYFTSVRMYSTRKLSYLHLQVTTQLNAKGTNFKTSWSKQKGYTDIYIDLPQAEYAGKSSVIDI